MAWQTLIKFNIPHDLCCKPLARPQFSHLDFLFVSDSVHGDYLLSNPKS